MLGKILPLSLITAFLFSGCASVTDKIPTVKIERKKPRVIKTVEANTLQANYASHKVEKAEAAMVCENGNMRSRARDGNSNNDNARVLILEEGGRSSNIIADVEVNCRDYFQRASTQRFIPSYSHSISVVSAPQPAQQLTYVTTQSVPARPLFRAQTQPQSVQRVIQTQSVQKQPDVIKASTHVKAANGYYYSIKKGDTLYRIARENCSSVNDISALNGIKDPTKIEVHQIIRLPAKKCNARN